MSVVNLIFKYQYKVTNTSFSDQKLLSTVQHDLASTSQDKNCYFLQDCEQPRSQSIRGETVTKTLVKFILSFQNFGKIACAVRHNRIAIQLNTVVSHCACDFFPKFWNDKTNFTPGIEVGL